MIVVLWESCRYNLILSFYYDLPKITTTYLLTKIEFKGLLDKVNLQKLLKLKLN